MSPMTSYKPYYFHRLLTPHSPTGTSLLDQQNKQQPTKHTHTTDKEEDDDDDSGTTNK